MFTILVVGTDKKRYVPLCSALSQAGFAVHLEHEIEVSSELLYQRHYDLLLLFHTPGSEKELAFTTSLSTSGYHIPIMLFTAATAKMRCVCLSAGADECMSEPLYYPEVIYRINALFRRYNSTNDQLLQLHSFTADYTALAIFYNNEKYTLPQKEFLLLYKLLSSPGRIFTRAQLMEEIWGPASDSLDATLTVHVNRLRKRFEPNPDFHISAIRGIGYKLETLH